MSQVVPGFPIGNYTTIDIIDKKSSTSVWIAENTITKFKVAIKVIPKKITENPNTRIRFNREISLQKSIKFPFIADFFELIEDDSNFYFVMEYVEKGSMLQQINSSGRISETRARHFFCQIITVIDFLHNSLLVAHRNLNAEHVLLDRYNNIRVINFGLSNFFTDESFFHTACGTPAFAAPEMITGQPYTKSTDIWAAGILLYYMVVGDLPYSDDNVQRLLQKIVYTDVVYPQYLSPEIIDLLKKMLQKDPSSRATLDTIIQHPWFSQLEFEILQKVIHELSMEGINKDVLQLLQDHSIDIPSLSQALSLGEFSPTTAIYKQFLKNYTTDRLKMLPEMLRNIPTNKDNPDRIPIRTTFSSKKNRVKSTSYITDSLSNDSLIPKKRAKVSNPTLTTKKRATISQSETPAPQHPMRPRPKSVHIPITQRIIQVPSPVQIANRRLSRQAAQRRTLDDSSINTKQNQEFL